MKTGINIQKCNIYSAEKHNRRDQDYMDSVNASPNKHYSIFEDQTQNNEYWVNPEYAGKSLPELLDELRALYREKVGQAPQEEDRTREVIDKKTGMKRAVTTAGWSPIREGVCPCKPDTKISDFDPFVAWLKSKGVNVIGIYIHHDEGHIDVLTDERNYNDHAHLIIDWVDHATGKTIKLTKADTSEMQTVLAEALGMERGEPKATTGADHLSPDEYRAKAAAARVKELEKKFKELEEDVNQKERANVAATDEYRKNCTELQKFGRLIAENFSNLKGTYTDDEEKNHQALLQEIQKHLQSKTFEELLRYQNTLQNLIRLNMESIRARTSKIMNNVDLENAKKEIEIAREEEYTKGWNACKQELEKSVEKKNEEIVSLKSKVEEVRNSGLLLGDYAKELQDKLSSSQKDFNSINSMSNELLQILLKKYGVAALESTGARIFKTNGWQKIKNWDKKENIANKGGIMGIGRNTGGIMGAGRNSGGSASTETDEERRNRLESEHHMHI